MRRRAWLAPCAAALAAAATLGACGKKGDKRPPLVDTTFVRDASPRDTSAADRSAPNDGAAPRDASLDAASKDAAVETQDDARPASDATDSDGSDGAASAAVHFTDVTSKAGVGYIEGPSSIQDACIAIGCFAGTAFTGGAAAGDYDGDGRTDLYVTRFGGPGLLFRNQGDGTFADVSSTAGLGATLPGSGAGWADVDNDGDEDLYVTTMGDTRYYLFINDGAGHFTEDALARGASLSDPNPHQGYSVGFGDYDRDGWVDLHVDEWRSYDVADAAAPSNTRLLHNLGASSPGHFEDVTFSAGLSMDGLSPAGVFAFTSSFTDLDGDGWPDLAVAADYDTSRLFWNNGDGTFTDGTVLAGVGLDHNGMGSALGDYDGDGRIDWFVTAIGCYGTQACTQGLGGNRLYRNTGGRKFSDTTDVAGVRSGGWGWAATFFDYDNDGDLDLVMTNGMTSGDPNAVDYLGDPMRLWRNDGGGKMTEVSAAVGLTDVGDGKGLVVFDYDRDGDLDVFVVHHAGGPILYRNDGGNQNGWLRVKLVGKASNRDGYGARVRLRATAGGPVQTRELVGGSNFISQNEGFVHFGLGKEDGPIAEVEVTWPRTGAVQKFTNVASRATITAREP